MNVTIPILCPGPSLASAAHDLRPGLAAPRIFVNRAIELGPDSGDWWVYGDRQARDQWGHHAKCQVCCPLSVRHWRTLSWENLAPPQTWPVPDIECNYSMIAAIFLAAKLGAREILLYGADMAGTADWDGSIPDSRRDDFRWSRERTHLAHVTKILEAADITVRRA